MLSHALVLAVLLAVAHAQLVVKTLRVSRVAAPDYLNLAEVQLWTPAGINAARLPGVTAAASSVLDGNVEAWGPQNLFDGLAPSYDAPLWHSSGDWEPETWARVTLLAPTAIAVVTVWCAQASPSVILATTWSCWMPRAT